MQSKKELREYFRKFYKSNLRSHGAGNIIGNAQSILSSLKPGTVGIYIPLQWEPDLLPLVEQNPHINFALPKIIQDNMEFVLYQHGDILRPNPKLPLLLEQTSSQIIMPDLIFVPGLSFDFRGYRLGFGKGHYDKYLAAKQSIRKVGVCFSRSLRHILPNEPHDCKMQTLITEYFIIKL
ncbi:MAG: 5-formyltetrahydrofolate cyclo-ligase [Pseudomonadota bacterium]